MIENFQNIVRDIIDINKVIYSNNYHKLGMNEIADPYNNQVKPKLELFKRNY
jgi:hypothetical protein